MRALSTRGLRDPKARGPRLRKVIASAVLALVVVVGIGRPAVGEDAEARLEALSVKLKEHSVADEKRHAATTEIGKAEALRDKARTLTKKRSDRDELARTLDELDGTVALVGAVIIHAEAKAKMDEQKAKMAKVKADLAEVQAKADKLEAQQAEMEKKIGGAK